MSKFLITRRLFTGVALATSVLIASTISYAGDHKKVDSIHFLIPVALVVDGMAPQEALVRH